jgi:transcriptional regulator with XRE-family HTH domain
MLLRDALGETLRDARTRQNRTLRDVSTAANVSLGYLSEVERGRKEASSELLASICDALDVRLSDILDEASTTLRSTVIAASAAKSGRVAVTTNSVKAGMDPRATDGNLRIVLPYSMTRSAPSVA